MDALQSAVIEKEVASAIARRFAETGLADLDAVLDMLFTEEARYQVTKEAFKDFVTRQMHTHVSDRDFDLFLRSKEGLNKWKDRIDKADLLDALEGPFRDERYQYLEKQAVLKGLHSVQDTLAAAGAPQAVADRVAGLQGAGTGAGGPAGHYASGLPTETLGEAYLRDTLNNRDEAWGFTQKPGQPGGAGASLKKPRPDRR